MRSGKLFALVFCVAALVAADHAFAAGKSGGSGRSGAGRSHHHRHHAHRNIFVAGTAFLPAWYYYYPPPVWLAPMAPTHYIERGAEQGPESEDAWLYCAGPGAYFPTVVECAGGWQRVPAGPPE